MISQSHYNRSFNSDSSDILDILYQNYIFCDEIFEGRFSSQKYFYFFDRDEFFNLVKNRNRENVASVRFSGRIPG